jgi:NACHT domain
MSHPFHISSVLMLGASSSIIQEVKLKCDRGLALMGYYYFDFKDIAKQGIRGLLTSLVAQFCAKSDPCHRILSSLYSENHAGSQQPNNDALKKCLKAMLRLPQRPTMYIIVDAIDECPNTSGVPTAREEVLDFLEELINLELPNLRICVTSRPEIDIHSTLEPVASAHVSLHDEIGQKQDILHYINAFVHSDRRMRKWRQEDKQLVIDTLSTKAQGM